MSDKRASFGTPEREREQVLLSSSFSIVRARARDRVLPLVISLYSRRKESSPKAKDLLLSLPCNNASCRDPRRHLCNSIFEKSAGRGARVLMIESSSAARVPENARKRQPTDNCEEDRLTFGCVPLFPPFAAIHVA